MFRKNIIAIMIIFLILPFAFDIAQTESNKDVSDLKKHSKAISNIIESGIKENEIYYLDTNYHDVYINGIEEYENNSEKLDILRSYHQIIYFNNKNEMISCNSSMMNPPTIGINSFIVKDWNHSGMYNTFPPTDIYNSPLGLKNLDDSGVSYFKQKGSCKYVPSFNVDKDSILKYMHPLMDVDNAGIDSVNYDYTIFIFAHLLMTLETVQYELKAVEDNIALDSGNHKIKRYFVLSDTLFMRPQKK